MSKPTRFREIEVHGPPRELGRQIGEAAGEEIRGFCEIALQRVNQTVRISRASAMKVARESIRFADEYSPDMVEELRGTAEAARVTLDDLMLLQVRNQLQPDQDAGCTSLACAATARTGGLVAQNWDNDPVLDQFTIVLTRRPAGKPAFTTITQAGLIAYIGFSDAGLGLCLNTLPAPSRLLGVPHYFLVRGIYESRSLEEAVAAVRRGERAIPANVMLITPRGPADLEITLDHVHVPHDTGSGCVTHTNHCLHPELLPINEQFPELIQSHARKRRIDLLLDASGGVAGAGPQGSPGATAGASQSLQPRPPGIAAIQTALRDHESYPRSICRHANDEATYGFWQTIFSVIIEPTARCMYLTRGNPCAQPYETYRLN